MPGIVCVLLLGAILNVHMSRDICEDERQVLSHASEWFGAQLVYFLHELFIRPCLIKLSDLVSL